MPGFDRTGPEGLGPLTGRGRGYCATAEDYNRPKFWSYRGYFGGRGRGWRNRYFATGLPGRGWWRGLAGYQPVLTQKEELELLQEDAQYFESELKNIRERISNVKKNASEKQAKD